VEIAAWNRVYSVEMAMRRPATSSAAKVNHRRKKSVLERIVDIGKRIPPEELARHPEDGAANLEHYLYGSPKQDVT
jgi:hypothetical protein